MMKLVTTAAGVLLTLSLAALLAVTSKSPSSAFGQFVKQVREARSMSYAEVMTIDGQQQSIKTKCYIAADGRKRCEHLAIGESGGITTIFDSAGQVRITLLQHMKRAIVQSPSQKQPDAPVGNGFLAWLQALKSLGDKPDKELGQDTLDGRRVTGFVATQGHFTFTMWVDNATAQPVRIEYDSPINGADYHVAMTDFRFDDAVAESLFSFDVPAGYTAQQQPAVPDVPGGEESVIEALRGYSQRDEGKFPTILADWGSWVVLFSKESRDGTVDPETTRVMAHLGAITPFFASMSKDDYAYLGEGLSVDQTDEIVFWYKRSDGVYRAIYGDLSVKDIAPENLPKK